MNFIMYIVPAIFSVIMIFNGITKYFGEFDREATKAVFYHYIPSKREEKNWRFSQKLYGKNLLIAGLLNVVTVLLLIPVGNRIVEQYNEGTGSSLPMTLFMFVPSLIYMFGARILMELKLKKMEEE